MIPSPFQFDFFFFLCFFLFSFVFGVLLFLFLFFFFFLSFCRIFFFFFVFLFRCGYRGKERRGGREREANEEGARDVYFTLFFLLFTSNDAPYLCALAQSML